VGITPELWETVKTLFQEALQRPSAERIFFLEQNCSNSDVRREVITLLAGYKEADDFLSEETAAKTRVGRLRAGDILAGRFNIQHFIAAGGMGEVYAAEDLELREQVAIKIISPEILQAPSAVARFKREVQLARKVTHPNICRLYDFFRHQRSDAPDAESQLIFVSMELLEGETLSTHLHRQQRMTIDEALPIVTQMAAGLAAAHQANVVHRDFKPGNVMLVRSGLPKSTRAVITDFGLAVRQTSSDTQSTLTSQQALAGTPAYMAPEVIKGEVATASCDIYALGLVIYEMITGQLPFQAETPMSCAIKRLSDRPVSPRELVPKLPRAWERAILRCLELEPSNRFASANDVVRALTGRVPSVHTQSVNRLGVAAKTAVAVVVFAGMVSGGWYWHLRTVHRGRETSTSVSEDDPTRRVLAVLPFENISNDRSQDYFSAGMTEEISGQLSKLASLQVLSRAAVSKYRDSQINLRRIATELGAGSVVLGSVRQQGSRVRINVEMVDPRTERTMWSDQYDRELKDIFAVQSDVALRIAGALRANLSANERERIEKRPTENMVAYRLYLRSGQLKMTDRQENLDAIRMLAQALKMDPTFAAAEAQMAYRAVYQAFWDPRYRDSGIDMAQKALALDPSLADAHVALAAGYYFKGKAANTRLSLLKAMELNPNDWEAMNNLSILESDIGHYDEALHWARRGFQLNPNSGVSYYHVGLPLLYLGDDAVTERWLAEGEQHFPSEMRIQILLAALDLQRGRERNALERALKAAAAQPAHEELLILIADLALIMDTADVETRVEQFFRSSPDLSPAPMMLLESPRAEYAYLLARRGATTRATELMQQAAKMAREAVHQGNEMPSVRLEVAAIYAVQQQKEPALDWLQHAYDAGCRDHRTLARDPMFAAVRDEPRFKELLSRMKKDVAAMRERSSDLRELFTSPVPEPAKVSRSGSP
jgi:serine/threonine protein kinase/Tfp pilus assembly protein PilF